MSEAVFIAIIVAGAALITQLIVSWVQPFAKSSIEQREKRRAGICECFSEMFGLLGCPPTASDVNALAQKDRSDYDKTSTGRWFFRFNSLLWESEPAVNKFPTYADISYITTNETN